jgi:hypothetical protein
MVRRKLYIGSRQGGCSPAHRLDRQGADTDDVVPDTVRSAAVAAFHAQDLDGLVLDLVADTWSTRGSKPSECIRRLRFAGHGWGAVVDVRKRSHLTLDVRISPDEPGTIEVRTADASGRVQTHQRGSSPFEVPPGLVSVRIRGRDDVEHTLARTAWILL